MATPMLYMTWEQIVDTKLPLYEKDIELILRTKSVWYGSKRGLPFADGVDPKTVANDKTYKVDLIQLDTRNACAHLRLQVPSRRVDLMLQVQPCDPFLLKLITKPDDHAMIYMHTWDVGQESIDSCQQLLIGH